MTDKNQIATIEFEVTQKCNLACSYCFLGDRNDSARNMNKEVADKALALLFNNIGSRKEISITFWGGEPLLNFGLIKYIIEKSRGLAGEGVEINYAIISNGTVLNNEILDFLNKENVRLQISLDGVEETHDYYRKTKSGKGSYQIIQSNLKKIADYNEINDYRNFGIKSTVTKQKTPITTILEDFNKKNYHYSITPVTSTPFFTDEKLFEPHEIEELAKTLFQEWKTQFLENGVFRNHVITKTMGTLCFNQKQKYSCMAGLSDFGVSVDGQIYPCHRLFNYPKFAIGDVWNGINMELSNTLYNHTNDERELCRNCGLIFICSGTCPVDSLIKGGFNEIDPLICAFNKTIITESIRFLLEIKRTNTKKYEELIKMLNLNNGKQENLAAEFPFKEINTIPLVPSGFQDRVPVKSGNAKVIDLEEDGIIYIEGDSDGKYIANVTTMAIWDLIDGVRTTKDIAGYIADLCKIDLNKIEEDIYKQIASLKELGFINV